MLANKLLTIQAVTSEALKVLETEFTGYKEYFVEGCSGDWVIVERLWGKSNRVIANYKTKEEANAVLKLMEGNNHGEG